MVSKDQSYEFTIRKWNLDRYGIKKIYGYGIENDFILVVSRNLAKSAKCRTIDSLVSRSSAFLSEMEQKDYDNVLIVCHGGIIRALRGYMEDKTRGNSLASKTEKIVKSLNMNPFMENIARLLIINSCHWTAFLMST